MIDLHVHILPGIDDGASSLEESLAMLEKYAKDGVTGIVYTPHIGHYLEFASDEREGRSRSAQAFVDAAAKRFPHIAIYPGAELFYRNNVLEHMPYVKHEMNTSETANTSEAGNTLNGTRYLLMEFDREISFNGIMDACHEVKVLGYLPILAHIEQYPCLWQNSAGVQLLVAEGVLTQVTASSVYRTENPEMSRYMGELIRRGLVHVVASDAHGSRKRRPRMREAYDYIAAQNGGAVAELLTKVNPQSIIDNAAVEVVLQSTKKMIAAPPRGVSKQTRWKALAVSVGFLVISAFSLSWMWHNDAPITRTSSTAVLGDQQIVTEVVGDAAGAAEAAEAAGAAAAVESAGAAAAAGAPAAPTNAQVEGDTPVDGEGVKAPSSLSKQTIETNYLNQLEKLQVTFEAQVETHYQRILYARDNISDKEERDATINSIVDEVGVLEAQSDDLVFDLLYEMQNELEDQGYTVEAVKKFREGYLSIKKTTKQKYSN